MSLRTRLFISLALVAGAVAIALATLARQEAGRRQTFPATVDRDCAPWDGSAFTVVIPMQAGDLSISIYQAPDLNGRTSFLFPDIRGNIGSAVLILPNGSPEPLKGKVTFQRVVQDLPVEGWFELVTQDGRQLRGNLIAEWGNQVILCG